MPSYDAIVIGSGQAGNPLAHNLADRGWSVALLEREFLGGSCINYGCTPTKAMLASARAAHVARSSADLGVHAAHVRVDLGQVVARKNQLVARWRAGQQGQVDSRSSLRLVRGEARFVGPRQVQVGDETLTSERVFINTGTRTRRLPIEGLDDVDALTNRTIMNLTEPPEHLLVLGGSYVGLEFGQMYRRFGSQVTVVEVNDQIVPREDEDVATALRDALEDEGIAFQTGAQATHVERRPDGPLVLTVRHQEDGREEQLHGSHVLLAAGRVPNTDALDLETAGVETDEHGWIDVDGQLRTSAEGVWALGDVKGGPAFTHISYNDFQIVHHNLFHDNTRTTEGRLVPYALFSDPELGRVGMSEREARDSGRNVAVASVPMAHVARAIESGDTAGLMKIVVDRDSEEVLGAAVLGPAGGELVQTLMVLMMAGTSWRLLEAATFIHPTLTEGFFSLMDRLCEVIEGEG